MAIWRSRKGLAGVLATAALLLSIGLAGYFLDRVAPGEYILVETVGRLQTELVAGNYTDGHMCFDFPTYGVNERDRKVEMFVGKAPGSYRLAYGSGFFAGGLVSSGGASGLKFVDRLPFTAHEQVDTGNGSSTVSITITEGGEVLLQGELINGTLRLGPGHSWTSSYDVVKEYQNRGDGCCNGTTCWIRYIGSTTIKNYGVWKRSGLVSGS